MEGSIPSGVRWVSVVSSNPLTSRTMPSADHRHPNSDPPAWNPLHAGVFFCMVGACVEQRSSLPVEKWRL